MKTRLRTVSVHNLILTVGSCLHKYLTYPPFLVSWRLILARLHPYTPVVLYQYGTV